MNLGQRQDEAIKGAQLSFMIYLFAWETCQPGQGLTSIWVEVEL
jgi:hypothetical protein